MVEINNQRKAFLDMLAWSEGTDNGRQKTKPWLWRVIVGGELFTDYPITLATVTLNPKLKSPAPDATSFFPLVGCLPQVLGLKDFSPKSRDAVVLQCRLKGAWRLPMIDRGDIRRGQSTVAAISGLHCRALVMVSSSIRLTAWLQNSKKRAERSERLRMSRVTAIISALVICIHRSACHGLLIITVITLITYKARRQKCQRTGSWRTRQLLTCRCVSAMLFSLMQNTRRRASWC